MTSRRPFTSLLSLENTSEYIAWRENKGSPLASTATHGIPDCKKKINKKIKQKKKKCPGKENTDSSEQIVNITIHPDKSFTSNSLIEHSDKRCVKAFASDIYSYLLQLEVI